jgi:hypothetical protein
MSVLCHKSTRNAVSALAHWAVVKLIQSLRQYNPFSVLIYSCLCSAVCLQVLGCATVHRDAKAREATEDRILEIYGERFAVWEKMADLGLELGAEGLPIIRHLVMDVTWRAFEEHFEEFDELQVEKSFYYLKRVILIKCGRAGAAEFDRLLLEFYYQNGTKAQALSDEGQIRQAVERFAWIGPKNSKPHTASSISGAAPSHVDYVITKLVVHLDQAEAEIFVTFHGKWHVKLERREVDRIRVWIPVEARVAAVY